MSRTGIALLTGSAATTAALLGYFLDMAWYLELPLAVLAGLLVGIVVARVGRYSE